MRPARSGLSFSWIMTAANWWHAQPQQYFMHKANCVIGADAYGCNEGWYFCSFC